ncbi:FadR/GntR family transcriptional regulator [Pseudorhodobacter wandonensis]|jgi:GntR family transcriptional regulator, transcriptional repressor for pyruvate dehydrogenase complex|uniref:FadR/GntR family transcriptional regulator n=1 Tax=Pseudorhodobacter wandonensis TaxID=1120568 RepID=UPI00067BC826|nr:FadR/GntR family transcriptional regulator [Pseudorhodobacter wandonensis]
MAPSERHIKTDPTAHEAARTLADQAYEQILSMIIHGEIAVGAKLPTEHALSQRFGMSRPVLRQALQHLRNDDLIVSRQGSGSYVTRKPDGEVLEFAPIGSIADIQRTFEFRVAVEGEAAYFAAKRRSDAELAAIKAALLALDACIAQGELGADADEDFHAAICDASGNQYFTAARHSMKANILTGLNLTRNLSLTKPKDRLQLVQKEHYAIYNAIAAGDQIAAREAMRAHIENARKRVFDGTPES